MELHCIDEGKYCFQPPNEEILKYFPEVDEKGMLKENVRAKCIYNEVDAYNENDRHLWFNYLYNVRFTCLEVYGTITDGCAVRVMNRLKINRQEVAECMYNNTIKEMGDSHINTILEEDVETAN